MHDAPRRYLEGLRAGSLVAFASLGVVALAMVAGIAVGILVENYASNTIVTAARVTEILLFAVGVIGWIAGVFVVTRPRLTTAPSTVDPSKELRWLRAGAAWSQLGWGVALLAAILLASANAALNSANAGSAQPAPLGPIVITVGVIGGVGVIVGAVGVLALAAWAALLSHWANDTDLARRLGVAPFLAFAACPFFMWTAFIVIRASGGGIGFLSFSSGGVSLLIGLALMTPVIMWIWGFCNLPAWAIRNIEAAAESGVRRDEKALSRVREAMSKESPEEARARQRPGVRPDRAQGNVRGRAGGELDAIPLVEEPPAKPPGP